MAKIYAVRKGRENGLFESWDKCQESIKGFAGAEFKSFKSKEEAIEYLGDTYVSEAPSNKELHLPKSVEDEVKWLLEQIIEQAWCGMGQLVDNYAHNLADALDIKLDK